ncbi:XdhC family protein [Halalkalibacter flavus]|uniref:XdhC family protein n=1 Tax=Halalkalibacter flavus TaxID=3090668 RepID=UPI002FC79788
MKGLYEYLTIIKQHPNQTCALATVIQVEGSSYRHEGAKMLFLENGIQYGLISGGCLEEDLRIRANGVISKKKPETITYDLQSEDDLGWGQGAGCNGKIKVLLEPIDWKGTGTNGESSWGAVFEAFKMGEDVISIREFTGEKIGSRLFFTKEGKILGQTPLEMERLLCRDAIRFYQEERIFDYQMNLELNTQFLFELHESKDMIYIFGAGPDVEPVVKRAAEFDFLPIVIDPRESRCRSEFFPDAAQCIQAHPEHFLASHSFLLNSYVLIMTHSFARDKAILSFFSRHHPKYVGILGPRRRTERLLHPMQVPEWIHSPIGIDIDAEGAEEISLSIVGELIKVRNKKRVLNKHRKLKANKTKF